VTDEGKPILQTDLKFSNSMVKDQQDAQGHSGVQANARWCMRLHECTLGVSSGALGRGAWGHVRARVCVCVVMPLVACRISHLDFGIECCHGRLALSPCMCAVFVNAALSLDEIDFVTEGRILCTVHVCIAMD